MDSIGNPGIIGLILEAETKKPVVGANIRLDGDPPQVNSDEEGRFTVTGLAPGLYTLTVSHVAYAKKSLPVYVYADGITEILTYMVPIAVPTTGITVTGTPTAAETFILPQNVSVTPRADFAARAPTTTAELLREESGILVQKTTHGHGAPIIRGLIGKYVLLLYDGVRLNKPTFRFGANQYLNTVDFESLERIEVVRGPSSVMYGSDAIGGAVNLLPARAPGGEERAGLRSRVVNRYASADDSWSIHADASGNYRRISVASGLTFKRVNDLRAGGNIGIQSPTGWDELDFSLRSDYLLNANHRLMLDYIAVRQDDVPRYDKYVSGDFQQFVYDPQDRDLIALGLRTSWPNAGLHSLKFRLSYQRETEGRIEQRKGSEVTTRSEDRITTWGGIVHASSQLSANHVLGVGAECYDDQVDSRRARTSRGETVPERPTYPDGSRYRSLGIFSQDCWSVFSKLALTIGVRYSRFALETPLGDPFGYLSQSYNDVTGAAHVSYRPDPDVNVIGGWSRGFRAPNLNDVAVLKYSSSGVDAPSPGLSPEHSHNIEIGTKIRTATVTGSLFLFYNRLNNLVERKPGTYEGKTYFDENGNGSKDPGEFDVFQRRNVGKARLYGFEYAGLISIRPRWEARMTASWTRGDNLTDHEYLSRIPPLMGSAALRYRPGPGGWLEAAVRWADAQRHLSARDRDDSRIDPNGTPGWLVMGLRGETRLRSITVNVSLQNLMDKAYKEHGSGVHSPGRSIVVSVEYTIP